jgi:hypothetical protein
VNETLLSRTGHYRETVDTNFWSDAKMDDAPSRSTLFHLSVALKPALQVNEIEVSSERSGTSDITSPSPGRRPTGATTRDSRTTIWVALVIVYLLMVIFSHWGYPLLIMLAIPWIYRRRTGLAVLV